MKYIKNQIKKFIKIVFIIIIAIQSQAFTSLKKSIKETTKTKIIPTIFSPKFINYSASNMGVIDILPSEKLRSEKIILLAKSKYPDKLLQSNLKSVYVFKYLAFSNVVYGATNWNSSIYLTNNGIKNGFTNNAIEKLFHHELAHILLKKYYSKFDSKGWGNINTKKFKYLSKGFDALKTNKNSEKFETNFLKKGFLNQYSQSDKDEDFAEIAQNIFAGDKEFWDIVDKYTKVKNKVNLAIDFYHKIDSSFNEKFFRNLASK